MNTEDKISRLRELMDKDGLHAYIIPTADPHQSEYVADHWQIRKWLTGFTGSAGTALLTRDAALLWTDSRYWIQASRQLGNSGFQLMKQGDPETPSYSKWLLENLNPNDRTGIDGRLFSADAVETLRQDLAPKQIALETDRDLFRDVWPDRPAMPASDAFDFPVAFAGAGRKEKLARIQNELKKNHTDVHIITALDDIAWIFNLRGTDIVRSPVNLAFAAVYTDRAVLFIHPEKLSPELSAALEKDGIQIQGYGRFMDYLRTIPPEKTVLLHKKSVNHTVFSLLEERCLVVDSPSSPAGTLKAVKNPVEINHIKDTMVKDGVAVTCFLHWIETRHGCESITELSAGQKIRALREGHEHFIDNSFNPIMAFRDHSPICHYSADPSTDIPVNGNGMFLADTGGNYLTGTTDITRTVYLGTPPREAVTDYTLVLKGHIAVARAVFPKGTRGYQLDTLARQHMWKNGMNFGHGTGHGVGFFLNVHEGPASISPHPIDTELVPGMLLTNEPGIYREGQYGIRIENMILVTDDVKTGFGQFLSFDNLTLCHYETALMDMALLDGDEVRWINEYHDRVYTALAPRLDTDVRNWLRKKTAPL